MGPARQCRDAAGALGLGGGGPARACRLNERIHECITSQLIFTVFALIMKG